MSKPKNVPAKKVSVSVRLLFLQGITALLVFLLFSVYVWGAQLKYDEAKFGYERALFYAMLILGAGLSYDTGKAILLMPQARFRSFGAHLGASALHIMSILLLCVASVFLLNGGHTFPGQLVYVAALGWLWFLVSSFSKALEILVKSEG